MERYVCESELTENTFHKNKKITDDTDATTSIQRDKEVAGNFS